MSEQNKLPEEEQIEKFTLTDEEGNEIEFELIGSGEVDGVMYYAMIPVEEAEDENRDVFEYVILKTAVEVLTGEELQRLDFTEVRGQGIKEASYNVAGLDVKVAVASGAAAAHEIMEKVKNGTADYQFIEIMGCPGGCVNGGGQPIQHAVVHNFVDLKGRRAAALYEADKNLPKRKSHESEAVKKVYAEFLGEPNSHKAHEVLHTSYVKRPKYK